MLLRVQVKLRLEGILTQVQASSHADAPLQHSRRSEATSADVTGLNVHHGGSSQLTHASECTRTCAMCGSRVRIPSCSMGGAGEDAVSAQLTPKSDLESMTTDADEHAAFHDLMCDDHTFGVPLDGPGEGWIPPPSADCTPRLRKPSPW